VGPDGARRRPGSARRRRLSADRRRRSACGAPAFCSSHTVRRARTKKRGGRASARPPLRCRARWEELRW